ncbi:uncharacterized protein LOC131853545 [Achroia grisella]|uniref:uncharacterized protein LOC131853545 n=1 Tax=Achroia grisella TaxID=688607 RepID=UPI0027D23BC8|nr:uncharacterized protein LOC131853545 [Achroia grisella]
MTKRSGKKRKKKEEISDDTSDDINFLGSDSESAPEDVDKYKAFQIPDYVRYYPEDGGNFEYIVFMESTDSNKPIGDRDMMSLATNLKKYNKGVKQLLRMNKFKIGVIFERPGLANAALVNKKFLDGFKLKASIPASATEVTGVVQHVPTHLSNEQIYSNITSSKNIVCVRRFMRRIKGDDNTFTMQPTKTVSITFSCPVLPDTVDLNSWRFVVRPYIPPVKQCLKCLRYGHIAKFCKNAERCSVCGNNHNFKNCSANINEAKCCHCNGNHIAISSQCPIKKKKIEENKNKVQSYADIVREKSFPQLGSTKTSPSAQFISLLNSDQILNTLLESIVKIITLNRTNDKTICTENIKQVLLETLQNKKNPD